MSPQEFWRIVEVRKPQEKVGNLTRDEFDDLRAMLEDSGDASG